MSSGPTITLSGETADALLEQHGWQIARSPRDHGAAHYVIPGGRSRDDGGKFGADWLWQRDEALTDALTDAALSDEQREVIAMLYADARQTTDSGDLGATLGKIELIRGGEPMSAGWIARLKARVA